MGFSLTPVRLALKPQDLDSFITRQRTWWNTLIERTHQWWLEKRRTRQREQLREEALKRQEWLALQARLRQRLHERLGKTKR